MITVLNFLCVYIIGKVVLVNLFLSITIGVININRKLIYSKN